jgi:hypothetical protein
MVSILKFNIFFSTQVDINLILHIELSDKPTSGHAEFIKLLYAKEITTGRLPHETRNRETSGYCDITKKENFLKIDFAECEWG